MELSIIKHVEETTDVKTVNKFLAKHWFILNISPVSDKDGKNQHSYSLGWAWDENPDFPTE